MPELPEVQTVVDGIQGHIVGKHITDMFFSHQRLRRHYQDDIQDKLLNKTIRQVYRRGKYIAIQCDVDLVIHLGMSGKLLLKDQPYTMQKHDHVCMYLDHHQVLVFNDPRRFGMFFWHVNLNEYLSHYGPEPLSECFTKDYLYAYAKRKHKAIKELIMDQTCVVGVGNIYACEALFLAGIHPFVAANTLSEERIAKLVKAIKQVLSQAIKSGGTTLKDYRTVDNNLGYFQRQLLVYGRADESCYTCGERINVQSQAGRSTFYCLSCQKR